MGFASLAGTVHAAIPVSGTAVYTQNFNTLPTGAARAEFNWTDDTSIQGFYLHRSNSPVAPQNNLAGTLATAASRPVISDGSEVATAAPNFHGFLSLGAYNSTERSLGASPTTNDGATNWAGGTLSIVAIYTNTGAAPTDLTGITFDLEAWRGNSVATNAETITLTAKTGTAAALLADLGTRTATATFTQTGWNPVPITSGSLDYTSADGFTATPAVPPSSITLTGTLTTPIRVAAGQSVALRWGNVNDGGADAQVGIDNVSAAFTAPSSSVTPVVSAVVRDNNGTPTIPGDDKINFTLTVTGSGAVSPSGWVINTPASLASSGTYGTPKNFTGIPISEFAAPPHTLTGTVQDSASAATNASFTVTAPWGTIAGSVTAFTYNDALTPNDASDDTAGYTASATGTFTGANYIVDTVPTSTPTSVAYGSSVSIPIPATPTGPSPQHTLSFTDDADPTLTSNITVNPPAIIGVNSLSGSPVNLFSQPAFGDRRWTFNGTTRVSTQTSATQVDHTVDSTTLNLTSIGAVQVTATLDAIAGTSSGFEAADRFALVLIIDGGTPVSILGSADTNGNGFLEGSAAAGTELPGTTVIDTTKTFTFTGIVPASANSLQIRYVGNSNSPNETLILKDLLVVVAPPTLVATAGAVTWNNQGTVNPADDTISAPVTISAVNLGASTGWTSNGNPASGLYADPQPVTFTALASASPSTVTVSNASPAVSSSFTLTRPAPTLTATLVAGSIVRNINGPGDSDDTVAFQVNVAAANAGPSFSTNTNLLGHPHLTSVSAGGAYAGSPVTLTLSNVPNSGTTVGVVFTDNSYPVAPAPVTVNVAIPAAVAPLAQIIGRKNFGAGLSDVTSTGTPGVAWHNFPASRSLLMTTGGAADDVVDSEILDLSSVGAVSFTAQLVARENSTGSNFETGDKFKAELIIDGAAPVSVLGSLDSGDGAPSAGPNGPADGYLNGFQGVAAGAVTAKDDYNANLIRDEFNTGGEIADNALNNTISLAFPIPAGANSVQLRISGRGVAGSEAFIVQNVLFSSTGPVDTDGDGMDDAYETTNGLNPGSAADKFLDLDNDGQNNYAEFLAGTAANNPGSKLAVVAASLNSTTGAFSIEWTSVPGKTYRIQGTPDLTAGSWTDLTGNIPASAGTSTILTGTFPGPIPARRYVSVKVVP